VLLPNPREPKPVLTDGPVIAPPVAPAIAPRTMAVQPAMMMNSPAAPGMAVGMAMPAPMAAGMPSAPPAPGQVGMIGYGGTPSASQPGTLPNAVLLQPYNGMKA